MRIAIVKFNVYVVKFRISGTNSQEKVHFFIKNNTCLKIVACATKWYFCTVKLDLPPFVQGAMAPKVGKTAKFIGMMIKTHLAKLGVPITKEQFIVLLCLEEGSKSQSFLAVLTERDKGSLTRLIQSLEKKSYLKRKVSQEDHRVNEVELTTKGNQVLEETKPIMKNLFAVLQNGIEEEEMEIATRVLEKIQTNATDEIERIEQTKK